MSAPAGATPLDSLLQAETPEGISLTLRPAGIVARGQAWLVDFLIRGGIFLVASIVGGLAGGLGTAFLLVAYFLLEWGYPIFFEAGRHGATPGKRIMGLQVVMDSGLPVTPAAAVVRNLLRAADFLPFLYAGGVAAVLLRRDFKRLGDLAAGTLVVYAAPAGLHGRIPEAAALPPARPLAQHEQAAIISWAGRAERLTPERLEELARIAAPAVLPPDLLAHRDATPALLGLAHWLLGHRGSRG